MSKSCDLCFQSLFIQCPVTAIYSLEFVVVHPSVVIDIQPPTLTCSCSSTLRVFWAERKVLSRSQIRVCLLIEMTNALQYWISRRWDWESTMHNARLLATTKSSKRARYFVWKASTVDSLGFDNRGVKKLAAFPYCKELWELKLCGVFWL